MAQAKTGDTVKIHYSGFLDDGTLFGSSRGEKPVEFIIGEGKLISGFESAVINMEEGDKKTVNIPPEDGFGKYKEDLVKAISKTSIPSHFEAKVGKVLVFSVHEGDNVRATVKDVTENEVIIDANHPFAGKELQFEIELLEIVS
ncbi:MAG: peptidylprolyl isomerase [Syntrophobacterales bacterium]|jgi:peptidylprolyl isomerase